MLLRCFTLHYLAGIFICDVGRVGVGTEISTWVGVEVDAGVVLGLGHKW